MAKKIRELMADSESLDVLHESHSVFRREQDEQLVQWMNRSLRHGHGGVVWRARMHCRPVLMSALLLS